MSDAAVRDLANRILARPEYAGAVGMNSKAQNWLARTLDRILHWIASLEILRGTSPMLYWVIVIAIATVCVGLIAHVSWTIWRAMTAPEPATVQGSIGVDAPDLAREAESLAAAGRYLEAGHRLMLASFRALAERSLIELRPDRSNRWIRGALRASPLATNLAGEIDALVEGTEHRWFGDRAEDPDIYARWRSAYAQLSSPPQ